MSSTFHASDPEKYEQLMGRWSRKLAPAFAAFAGVKDGERLLDVGCGTGSLSFAMRELAPAAEIVGIDVAESYLEYARARSTDDRIVFQCASATELPFQDGKFDRALSLLVLQFIPDSARVISELYRVVCSGGTVAACVWDNFGGMPHLRLIFDIAAALGYDQDHTLLRPLTAPGQLEGAWHDAGLTQVEASSLSIRFEFRNFEDYWLSLASGEGPTGRLLASLDTDARARMRNRVEHVFLSGKPDGLRSFAATAWICRGCVP